MDDPYGLDAIRMSIRATYEERANPGSCQAGATEEDENDALRAALRENIESRAAVRDGVSAEGEAASSAPKGSVRPLDELPEGADGAVLKIQSVHRGNVGRQRAQNKKAGKLDAYGEEVKERSATFEEGVGVKFMVGVDGSDVALLAWKTAVHMMQKGDMLVVYHCSNPGRYKSMPPMYDPKVILSGFETEAIKHDVAFKHRIDYVHEDKQSPSDRIRVKLLDYADANKVDVLVLGSYGAKGIGNKGVEHIGSSALEAVTNARMTTVVVKPTSTIPEGDEPARYLVAVDGSDVAHQGFLQVGHPHPYNTPTPASTPTPTPTQAAHLCQREDQLTTCTIGEHVPARASHVPLCFRPEVIQERYTEELQRMGYPGEAHLERCPSGMSIPTKFLKLAEEHQAHFLVFGSKGLSGSYAALGSVANSCIRKAKGGVVVVKLSSRDLRPAESLDGKGIGGAAVEG